MRRAVVEFSIRNRRRKAAAISRYLEVSGCDTEVLVGAVGSASQRNEAIVENAVGHATTVIAALDLTPARTAWPFVVGDGRILPWRSGAVGAVISNAVIEHVGDEADQRLFVAEHQRVGVRWVITTPNRWFLVEAHTSTVLRHWSRRWRAGREEFTRLLSLREFKALLPADAEVVGRWWSPTFLAFSVAKPGSDSSGYRAPTSAA